MVTVIWDTWLKPGSEEEGLRLTQQVWSDMRSFDGYVSHQVFVDEDAPGHIIQSGTWRGRGVASALPPPRWRAHGLGRGLRAFRAYAAGEVPTSALKSRTKCA